MMLNCYFFICRLMFFSDFSSIFDSTILRSAMDGSERKTIINKGVTAVYGIAVGKTKL